MSYVVEVDGPEPSWICINSNTNLPSFTFIKPKGISFLDAKKLKSRADNICGGTLSIVEIND
jgi:hypothetical protein